MRGILIRIAAGVLALIVVLPAVIHAQETSSSSPVTQSAPVFRPEELDQLLAPVALYPDALLAQILMASTYPLEVVQAARWARQPSNTALKGEQLAAALETFDWDPSVKSLIPFPQILRMMDNRLDWMEKLGDAFLAQQADVMDSVQRLRHQAQAAGTLVSTPQQVVRTEGETIVIEPANPDVIYVPVYNPTIAYGVWPYPAFPPFYTLPPPGYYYEWGLSAGIGFGVGVVIVRSLWGWGYCDWPRRVVHIDVARFNNINVHRPRIAVNTWQHDSFHRHGVPYRDSVSRARFEEGRAIPRQAPREFRGYGDGEHAVPPAPGVKPAPRAGEPPRVAPPGAAREQRAPPGQPPARQPPAFEGIGRGHDVRAHENRGRASSQGVPQGSRAAPSGGRPGGGTGGAGGHPSRR